MRKHQLEKAVELFDTIPGTNLIDKYVSKLYKEEIVEMKNFLDFVSKDIIKIFKANCGEEYIDTIKKEYVCQLNEIHQCRFTFYLENETDMSVEDDCYTDIRIQFRTFEKSTWTDQFVIEGDGKYKGISIEEYNNWKLLLEFILLKKKDLSKSKPSESALALDKIEDIQASLDEKDK